MSNDEEKEEEEVRRERVSLSVCVVFFLRIRAFRCTRRAILDFFGARDRRVLERRGCGVARNFAHFLILGWFFPVSDDDANRDVF